MKARMFRYLFENVDDGIVLSGGIRNTEKNQCTNFTYVCGMRNKKEGKESNTPLRYEQAAEVCHIFVLASYTAIYIESLLKMVRLNKVKTVVLPYLPPQRRLSLLHWYVGEGIAAVELSRFLECPYRYLKETEVENIYLVYGNGEVWHGAEHQLLPGPHFEPLDKEEQQMVQEMERHYVPVVKAGYLVENDWLFYFGHFGHESNFYDRSSGIISSSLAMFQGPLYTDNRKTDSIMTGKIFTGEKSCNPYFGNPEIKNCFYQCLYEEDHADFRKHKRKECDAGCFGTLAIGNINMGRFLPEVRNRFFDLWRQVRAMTLPGCGNREYWNRQCLTMILGESFKYWICGLDRKTSPSVISDVVVASPQNRLVTVSKEYGYCFSGYLVPLDEESTEI